MKRIAALLAAAVFMFTVPAGARAEMVDSIADTVSRVSPSVVSIFVVKRPPADRPDEPSRTIIASGSGFAVREGGYILSNAHVLDYALSAGITTSDGRTYPIEPDRIWADPVSDLAVAKVDVNLPPVTWADPRKTRLGDGVMALGSPYGIRFRGSVSRGIISGFERDLDADYTFIQTDAPINPGNSGGPLVNTAGEVVGVNARVIPGADGMGFAIPGDVARDIADRLIKDGKVDRAWLGLRFADCQEVDLGWSPDDGPVVTYIEPGGPADGSGIQVGDTVTRLEANTVRTIEEVGTFLRSASPGVPVSVRYQRGNMELTTTIRLSSRPHDGGLHLDAAGLWTDLTAAQRERARRYGQMWSTIDLGDLLDPWTTYSGDTKAVLETEYSAVAKKAWDSAREGSILTPEQAEAETLRHRGVVRVEVDLPTRWHLGDSAALRAEWTDSGGTTRALSVQSTPGLAPPGFQHLSVVLRSDTIEKRGTAVLVVHLDQENDRRFRFDLDQIH